jgi:hypothetical protein
MTTGSVDRLECERLQAELQLGKMYSPSFGVYLDGLIGIGGDRPYVWGVGVGTRFNY